MNTGTLSADDDRPGLAADSPQLSVIVPTFNERDNVAQLVQQLDQALAGINWEVIFVDDDSPDDTAAVVQSLAHVDPRVRGIHRIRRRGLSSACIEGMMSSSAPYLAVMDGDLQHDETLLPAMFAQLQDTDTEIVIGTRYAPGGDVGDWDRQRASISRVAARLSKLVLKADLSDPMSGFFMIKREVLEERVRSLSTIGFKILLDLFASSKRPLKFTELPYQFRMRESGESKLDSHAVWDFGMLLVDKLVGHIIPVRFISFSLIGGLGVLIHLAVMLVALNGFGLSFVVAHSVATVIAMTSNYTLNNRLTYRDVRLRGWQWVRGWLWFSLACSVGVFANVGIASYLFSVDTIWVLAALAGILMGTVWNYAVTKTYTWGARH